MAEAFCFLQESADPLTGNKGEWSEVYALLKLLADGKVHAGDENLNKLREYYPIVSVLRKQIRDYVYKPDKEQGNIVIFEDREERLRLPVSEFAKETETLLEAIKAVRGKESKGSFPIPNTEKFMRKIGCDRIKAPSSDKADIFVCIHDISNQTNRELGFSIKSQLGSASTLLNASPATNFNYRIIGKNLSKEDVDNFNKIDSHVDRMKALLEAGCDFEFDRPCNDTFRNNLMFIDGNMESFLAECLKIYNTTSLNKVKDIVEEVEKNNPLNFGGKNVRDFYEMKMKHLLLDAAMGMMPSKMWNGQYTSNGGYLVVKNDGDLVCYHFYNINDVQKYLYVNTKFENGGRKKHKFGNLYHNEEGQVCIKLNLQIRFTH